MKRAVAIFSFCLAGAWAASNWSAPLVGMVRDASNQLHPVYGVAGTFVLRGALSVEVLNWAFDASGGIVETHHELQRLDAGGHVAGKRTAPEGGAILSPSYAFFPKTGELWRAGAQDGGSIMIEPAVIAGRVVALGPADRRGMVLAACRASQLWLLTFSIENGALMHESAPAGAAGETACAPGAALLVLRDRLIVAAAHGIVMQTLAGGERHVSLPPNREVTLHRAGEAAVQIEISGSPSQMLRLTAEGERLYELPAAETRP